MNELLNNEHVQQALVSAIVIGLTAVASWIKSKTSKTSVVNEWWCYIHPATTWAMNEARNKAQEGFTIGKNAALGKIVSQAVVKFVDDYRANEGKQPSQTIIAAVENEIAASVARETT